MLSEQLLLYAPRFVIIFLRRSLAQLTINKIHLHTTSKRQMKTVKKEIHFSQKVMIILFYFYFSEEFAALLIELPSKG